VLGIAPKLEDSISAMQCKTPWIGTNVIIDGPHAKRHFKGKVHQVIRDKGTLSGLKITVRLDLINPTSSPDVTIDYDWVAVVGAR